MEIVGQTKIDIAYVAGFFDGEGCIQIHRRTHKAGCRPGQANDRTHFLPAVYLGNTNKDSVCKLQKLFGGTVKPVKRYKENHRPYWQWSISGTELSIYTITTLLPYLTVKREEALVFLEFCNLIAEKKNRTALTVDEIAIRQSFKDKLTKLKRV